MELIKPGINIDFVGKMKIAFFCSLAMIIISIISVIWHGGLNYGIDFAGGTLVQIKFQNEPLIDSIRSAFKTIGLENSIIQSFGSQEVVVRTAESPSDPKGLSTRMGDALEAAYGKGSFEIRRVEVVGPKVGVDLTRKAIFAIVFSWIGMLIYIGWRFEFRYALGGILALVHDVIITVGVFSLLNKEFDLTIVAALLTIIGYSINDTIVIFDRIRENARKNIRQNLGEVINASVNQTLSRTILISFTVFIVVVVLFFFGGAVIHDFAFALIIGVVVGTYSSIFIASPIVLAFEKIKPSHLKRKR
ncbi:MAG: protein translocase subunit SecF [Deltaproteobacteria bacterium]|nr:protein translocase subunit SecF [Deltaproteobacteria bacterium]